MATKFKGWVEVVEKWEEKNQDLKHIISHFGPVIIRRKNNHRKNKKWIFDILSKNEEKIWWSVVKLLPVFVYNKFSRFLATRNKIIGSENYLPSALFLLQKHIFFFPKLSALIWEQTCYSTDAFIPSHLWDAKSSCYSWKLVQSTKSHHSVWIISCCHPWAIFLCRWS